MKLSPFRSSQIIKRIKDTSAETLAEVLIALIVLSVGAVGAMTLVSMSIRANGEAEERLIAYNLAREGVEAIRSIRDTNWLRFPGDRANCWDVLPDISDPTTCADYDKLEDRAPYIVSPNIGDTNILFTWQLAPLSDASANPVLYEAQLDSIEGDEILYIHDYSAWCLSYCDDGEESPYSRIIEVEDGGNDSLEVTSTVTWASRGEDREIVFKDKLVNY